MSYTYFYVTHVGIINSDIYLVSNETKKQLLQNIPLPYDLSHICKFGINITSSFTFSICSNSNKCAVTRSLKDCCFQANLLAVSVTTESSLHFTFILEPYLTIWAIPLLTMNLRAHSLPKSKIIHIRGCSSPSKNFTFPENYPALP